MVRSLRFVLGNVLCRTWLVSVVTLVVCASFAARAVAALVEARYFEDAPADRRPVAPPPAPPAPRSGAEADAFVDRNMFCSACAPASSSGPRAPGYTGQQAVLIATSVGRDAGDGVATVRVVATDAQGSWGLGERIPGVGAITRIGRGSIDVADDAGHTTTLSLLADPAAAGGAAARAATHAPPPAADPFADRIRKLDDHTYEVDRDLVRELVTGATRPGSVRMLPIVKDGVVQGVRVGGVRPGSLPAAIGLHNADVLEAIDGSPIRNAQQLLDLYARIDRLSSVELHGTRRGKPLAIELRLR